MEQDEEMEEMIYKNNIFQFKSTVLSVCSTVQHLGGGKEEGAGCIY